MGNFKSCIACSRETAVVIDGDGTHHLAELPMTAREARYRFSPQGGFICNVEKMLRKRVANPMSSNRELMPGGFYLIVPLNLIAIPVSDKPAEILTRSVDTWRRTRANKNRVVDVSDNVVPNSTVLWC